MTLMLLFCCFVLFFFCFFLIIGNFCNDLKVKYVSFNVKLHFLNPGYCPLTTISMPIINLPPPKTFRVVHLNLFPAQPIVIVWGMANVAGFTFNFVILWKNLFV